MLVSIQPQADVPGKELILLLGELRVHLTGRGPGGGAVLLPVTGPALVGGAVQQGQDISGGAEQDRQSAVLRPVDAERILQRRRQLLHDVRQSAAQGLSDEQSGPDNGNVKKQADGEAACFGLFQFDHLQKRSAHAAWHRALPH